MVKTQCFHYRGLGSIPGQGSKIPQATWHSHVNNNNNKNKQLKISVERDSHRYSNCSCK